MDGGFMLMYEKGVPTYFEHNSQGASSTINLTFVNPVVHALDAAKEWTTLEVEVENVLGLKYNFEKTD
ncbi:hypothetical protein F5051DRAFT_447423 [Lentinula edodes]|nr:hypothetical protein F5051DRAFT_447423 [Lentinula edodes]